MRRSLTDFCFNSLPGKSLSDYAARGSLLRVARYQSAPVLRPWRERERQSEDKKAGRAFIFWKLRALLAFLMAFASQPTSPAALRSAPRRTQPHDSLMIAELRAGDSLDVPAVIW